METNGRCGCLPCPRTSRSLAAISAIVLPTCTVAAPAVSRRPGNGALERVVELEDAGAVAVAGERPAVARGRASPVIARTCRGVRSKRTLVPRRARRAIDLDAGLDLPAERAQQRGHRVGDRLRAPDCGRPAEPVPEQHQHQPEGCGRVCCSSGCMEWAALPASSARARSPAKRARARPVAERSPDTPKLSHGASTHTRHHPPDLAPARRRLRAADLGPRRAAAGAPPSARDGALRGVGTSLGDRPRACALRGRASPGARCRERGALDAAARPARDRSVRADADAARARARLARRGRGLAGDRRLDGLVAALARRGDRDRRRGAIARRARRRTERLST